MNKDLLNIDCRKEKSRIVDFLRKTFQEQGIENAVVGLSGGVDSATSLYLLRVVFKPENIYIAHLYYFEPCLFMLNLLLKESKIPEKNIQIISIKHNVDEIAKSLG
ncbi:hypothetical protein KKE68_02515, partial [Patescibacteria group bacterium]|nr:hypothetical protein [Patescibacteria group bacterium]